MKNDSTFFGTYFTNASSEVFANPSLTKTRVILVVQLKLGQYW